MRTNTPFYAQQPQEKVFGPDGRMAHLQCLSQGIFKGLFEPRIEDKISNPRSRERVSAFGCGGQGLRGFMCNPKLGQNTTCDALGCEQAEQEMLRANEFTLKANGFLLRAEHGLTGLLGESIIETR